MWIVIRKLLPSLIQYLAPPREGHLNATYGIFVYLKTHTEISIMSVDVTDVRESHGDVAEEFTFQMS